MTALRARTHAVPAHLSHLHPDWLPPGGYNPDGSYAEPSDEPPAHPTPAPTGLPRELNSRERSSATTPAAAPASPYGVQPWVAGSALPPPDPDGPNAEDEDAIFRDPYLPGGRETQLSYTALPLRHRIYALHCQGRSISAIARRLRLDRGTVARHLHAVEDLLLAEQTEDLARLRLRAIEAQHAVLAACWDALLCEELSESDASNEQPYPARRAQLLATAARAARTAAQLQGLFTPAALQSALAATPDMGSADGATPRASKQWPVPPVASCGMPASASAPQPPASAAGLPIEYNSAAGSPTAPSAPGNYPRNSIAGLALCTPPAPAERRSPISASPPPRTRERSGVGATHRPFIAAATAAVRGAVLQ